MPKLQLEDFNSDDHPKVGDKVTVKGEVQDIDTDSGEVEVSYDSVTLTKNRKRKKDKSLDDALSDAFPDQATRYGMVTPASEPAGPMGNPGPIVNGP